jgi:hypothetical protein
MSGTYTKDYSIEWLNANPLKQKITARYNIKAELDSGQKVEIEVENEELRDIEYLKIFGKPIKAIMQDDTLIDTTLGEYISYLTSCGIAFKRPEINFPQTPEEIEKFGTHGPDLFNN